jgi:hypothetical protein
MIPARGMSASEKTATRVERPSWAQSRHEVVQAQVTAKLIIGRHLADDSR